LVPKAGQYKLGEAASDKDLLATSRHGGRCHPVSVYAALACVHKTERQRRKEQELPGQQPHSHGKCPTPHEEPSHAGAAP
jgi:hypothetical protein